jgi:3'(2'), 5'-bisphosphate nucleotidase
LDTLVDIARDAGDVIMRVYAGDFAVEYKAPSDPVTAADQRANELICERLERSFPGDIIVAEESAPETFKDYRTAPRVFFVDPLDGTREFVARNGEFVVMIGMLEEGRGATAGVVHAPVSGTTWLGHLELGSFRLDATGREEPIMVGSVRRPELARVVASRSQRSRALQEALSALSARETLALGSAGLKGAQVAEARADAYVSVGRSGKLWDACAVDALVTAAGGRFTDARGERMDYRSDDITLNHGVLACNEHLHAALLKRLAAL